LFQQDLAARLGGLVTVYVVEEIVTTLVERVLGLALICFLVYLVFDQTAIGQAGLVHLSSWLESAQAWVADQHQQLGLGNFSDSAKNLASGIQQHVLSSGTAVVSH